MNKLVGVGFKLFPLFITGFADPAEDALSFCPGMVNPFKADIALRIIECIADRVFAVSGLGTINRPPGKLAGQLRDGDAE